MQQQKCVVLLARIQEEDVQDKAQAQTLYQQLLTKYPSSIYVAEARKRFRKLRGMRCSRAWLFICSSSFEKHFQLIFYLLNKLVTFLERWFKKRDKLSY